ncbi:hypothetical protein BWQ96_04235 [Gracilariopsis chorda]|uniref:Uncharacterized protein n=1 Tax=Gracilariopsis chorda TaxID=448386 RepID=A0A2V3IV62_9FLOR|nr:hypothetical protein BWQ96_04235 [Gracilariopsis chorda]|eukprot:PXF45979.1 hypothetical protein BWQ96_04235 [Gracilariopsis chorda]
MKKEFPSEIMHLKRNLNETYPVLAAAQGGWVSNAFLKEAIQRDKKAAAEAVKQMKKQAANEASGSAAVVQSQASPHSDQVQHSLVHLSNCVDHNKNPCRIDGPSQVQTDALEDNSSDKLRESSGVNICTAEGPGVYINNAVSSDDQNEIDEEYKSDQSSGEDHRDSDAAKNKDNGATGHFDDDESDDAEISSSGLKRKNLLHKHVTDKLSRKPLKHVVRRTEREGNGSDDEFETAQLLILASIDKKQPRVPVKLRSISSTEASNAQKKISTGIQGSSSSIRANQTVESHSASPEPHRQLSSTSCAKRRTDSSRNSAW